MENFCEKEQWSPEEWTIFLAKLDVLRLRKGLRKREFSELIGVWNIYRKDMKRPGPLTIHRICDVFQVSKEWLCSPISDIQSESRNIITSLADRIPHADIIQRFRNKDLAREINAKLLELESIDPERLTYVKGMLDGLLVALRPKKKTVNGD